MLLNAELNKSSVAMYGPDSAKHFKSSRTVKLKNKNKDTGIRICNQINHSSNQTRTDFKKFQEPILKIKKSFISTRYNLFSIYNTKLFVKLYLTVTRGSVTGFPSAFNCRINISVIRGGNSMVLGSIL